MANELIVALAVLASAAFVAWMLKGSRLHCLRLWICELAFLRSANEEIASVRSDIGRLASSVSSLQKAVDNLNLRVRANEAELGVSPSIHSFCRLQDRVESLEEGWAAARSVKRMLDASERAILDIRRQIDGMNAQIERICEAEKKCF